MSVLSDIEIMQRANEQGMIEPFVADQVRDGVISYGLSSYGYDARVADEWKVFRYDLVGVDPKNAGEEYDYFHADEIWVEPGTFVLGRTVERFIIPRDLLVICVGKSTLARAGLIVNVTPLEPMWEGWVTIEISNTSSRPVKVYANEGICQFIFLRADTSCRTSYADKGGKYNFQSGVVGPRL
jgi:dCTP deaminase